MAPHSPWWLTIDRWSGTSRSSASRVMATASTPSLNASSRDFVTEPTEPCRGEGYSASSVDAAGEQVVGGADAIEDEQPVEVIQLVLRRPRLEPGHAVDAGASPWVEALQLDVAVPVREGGAVGGLA